MKPKEYSCKQEKAVVVKAGKVTVVSIDYVLKMRGEVYKGKEWGVARKSEHDNFNYYFGLALAKIRARAKIAKAVEKKLVEHSREFCEPYTYKQVWGSVPRHMTATEALIKERHKDRLYPIRGMAGIIRRHEAINEELSKLLIEVIKAKRKEVNDE